MAAEPSSDDPESNPLADLDEWEDFLRERYPAPREKVIIPRLWNDRPAVGPRVLSSQPPLSDPRFRPGEETSVSGEESPRDGNLGGDGVPQHPGRRQRPRHRPDADRAPHADRRGDPSRRPPPLVHPDRLDPRPGQDPLPLRRAAMGRRRRYVPGRLPLFRTRSSSPSSSLTTPTHRSPSIRPSAASTSRRAGSSMFTCRGATTNTCITSSRITFPKRPWR